MTNDPAESMSTHVCASTLGCKTKRLKNAWEHSVLEGLDVALGLDKRWAAIRAGPRLPSRLGGSFPPHPRTRKKTPIVTPIKDLMKKISVASFGLFFSLSLLRRSRIEFWVASPEMNEQCVLSSKRRRAPWLPATDMPSTTGPGARVMLFHVAVQIPLRVVTCKGGAVYAY